MVDSTVVGNPIYSYESTSCPVIRCLNPDVSWDADYADIVFSVLNDKLEPVNIEGVEIEWVASLDGTPIITKSTENYSVITLGSTFAVHLTPIEGVSIGDTLDYITTINSVYQMTGRLILVNTILDTCFAQNFNITEREIVPIDIVWRGEDVDITRPSPIIACIRTAPTVECTRVEPIISVAPCGRRVRNI